MCLVDWSTPCSHESSMTVPDYWVTLSPRPFRIFESRLRGLQKIKNFRGSHEVTEQVMVNTIIRKRRNSLQSRPIDGQRFCHAPSSQANYQRSSKVFRHVFQFLQRSATVGWIDSVFPPSDCFANSRNLPVQPTHSMPKICSASSLFLQRCDESKPEGI